MIETSCHCGALRMEIDAPAPDQVNDCQCGHCLKRGALWAYYSPKQVRLIPPSGATFAYICGDRLLETHVCRTCGCTTHWAPIDTAYDRMGVNARLMAPAVLAKARVRVSPGP